MRFASGGSRRELIGAVFRLFLQLIYNLRGKRGFGVLLITDMNDEELKKALSGWHPEMPEEPGFHRSVFRRVNRLEETPSVAENIRGIIDWLTRPVIGLPAATMILAITTWLAIYNGTTSRDETWTNLSANYGELINPMSHMIPKSSR